MKICVLGLWHLGCVTSACLAKLGHTVTGVDFDADVIRNLQKGKAPLFEPGLDELLTKQLRAGKLSFTSDIPKAVRTSRVVWITWDTPVTEKDAADVAFLESNIQKAMPYFARGTRIIISSQVPVGFVKKIETIYKKRFPQKPCYFAYAPENLRLGKALDIFLHPDRVVIGVREEAAKKAFLPLFASITRRLEWMKTESAEMTKHALNAFLATSVCFANEVAALCERVGAEAKEVERGLKTESRIGPKAYLGPGTAFSGGTLARDVTALIQMNERHQLKGHLLRAVRDSNDFHKTWIPRKCDRILGSLKKKTIAILGLAYKPGTSTLRRSLAVDMAKDFYRQGAVILGYEPTIQALPKPLSKQIRLAFSLKEAIRYADLIIVMTRLPELEKLNPSVAYMLKKKKVIDPNGFLAGPIGKGNPKYHSIGKGF